MLRDIKKTDSVAYLKAFTEFTDTLLTVYADSSLIQRLINTLAEEQRESIELMNALKRREESCNFLVDMDTGGKPVDLSDLHMIYSVIGLKELESLARTLHDLLAEKTAAAGMATITRDLLHSGKFEKDFARQRKTFQSIDIESQSIVYQFRRSVGYSKKQPRFSKSMEVLMEIRKTLSLKHWD